MVKKGTEENLVKDGGFEEVIDAPQGWRIPVKAKNKDIDIDGLVEITDLSVNEHLVHYKGGDNISGLTMNCKYNVLRAANCYLDSSFGTQYWYLLHIRELRRSQVYSEEVIDLRKEGRWECVIPFTERNPGYVDKLAKGLNCIRGHDYFLIKDFKDRNDKYKYLGVTESIEKLASIDRYRFGEGAGKKISEFNREGIFTLANLEKYEIGIVDFRSNWKKEGWFTFKVEVVDADGDKYEIDRADVEIAGEYQATEKKEKLSVGQVFDENDVPAGYFQGRIGKEVPDKIIIRIVTKAATPRGLEIKKTEKVVKRGEGRTENMPVVKKKPVEPDKEARGAYFDLNCFDKNPEAGKKQIKELVSKAKKMNLNMLVPFAIETYAEAYYNTSNKYFKKYFTDWDPLEELIKEAHKEGIRVHPVVCLITEGAETLQGILTEHPEWATDGGKSGWLDPAVPEVKEYRINNILEIVKNYEVDGILLDYVRLRGGPSNKGAEIYQKEFGIDPRQFKKGDEEYKKWFIWEGGQLTELVSRINKEIKKVKPNIVLNAYVLTGGKYSGDRKWEQYHQPYLEWVEKGYLDMINPSGYTYDMLLFKCRINKEIQECKGVNPDILVYPCIGVHTSFGRLTAEGVVRQVEISREIGADGVIFFTWPALEPYADYVKEKVFNKKAGIPDLKKGKEKKE